MFLWQTNFHNYCRLHPLGELNGDLRYTDMYRWFNCMEMGPCHGWMTSNSTLRKITTKHARRLTRVLKYRVTSVTRRVGSKNRRKINNNF